MEKWERQIYRNIVLDNNLMDMQKNLALNELALSCGSPPPFYCGVVLTREQIEKIYDMFNPNAWKVARQMNHNRQRNKKRLKVKIERLLNGGDCLFLTLTLNDNTLNYITYDTIRQYVKRWLNSLNCNYVANVDFGEQNGRIHFHAIVQLSDITYEQADKWRKYGNINFKRITKNNPSALAEYIQKFVNHALKDSTKQYRIMYNRKKV